MKRRLLLRPGCLGWHYRPMSRDTLIGVYFADGRYGYINDEGRVALAGDWLFLGLEKDGLISVQNIKGKSTQPLGCGRDD